MYHKIRCDKKYKKICKILWKLNKALTRAQPGHRVVHERRGHGDGRVVRANTAELRFSV